MNDTNTYPSIMSYGGDNTGVKDNVAAFAAVVAACTPGQVCVFFPPGTYRFNTQVTYEMPYEMPASLTILGAGADVTNLIWPEGSGIEVTFVSQYNSVHIRDLSLLTSAAGAGAALYLNQTASVSNPANSAPSDITNVTCRGSGGYGNLDYWGSGVTVYGVSNVTFQGLNVVGSGGSGWSTVGTGVILEGSPSVIAAVAFNFANCTLNYVGTGIQYESNVQGVAVISCNFTGNSNGIVALSGSINLDQLSVSASQFNCSLYGILTQVAISNTSLAGGNLFIVPGGGVAVFLQAANIFAIVGNSINSAGGSGPQNGFVIGPNGSNGVITGNSIDSMNGSGIWLQPGSSAVNVQSNCYSDNGVANVTNQGTGNTVGGGSQ